MVPRILERNRSPNRAVLAWVVRPRAGAIVGVLERRFNMVDNLPAAV